MPTIILVVGLTTCVYSMLGGVLAVIWTDAIQSIVLTLRTATVFLGFASIAIAFAVIGVESALSTWCARFRISCHWHCNPPRRHFGVMNDGRWM